MADPDRACQLAADASDAFRETSPGARATFLAAIAGNIMGIGDVPIERGLAENPACRAPGWRVGRPRRCTSRRES